MATVSGGSQTANAKGNVGAATAAQNKPAFNLNTFLHRTTPQIQVLQPNQGWVDGQTQYWNLPQAGLASMMMVNVQFQIVVAGTVSGGTFQGLPAFAPWSLIKQLTFASNQNLNLISLSGPALYQWLRMRYAFDPFKASPGFFMSTAQQQYLGIGNGTGPVVPGAAVSAGTYNINLSFPVPVAYNRELLTGLLFLQNNSVLYQLGIQWGNVAAGISSTGGTNDIFNGLTGTGLSVTASMTSQTVEIETMLIPRNYPPDTSMFMSLNESSYPLTAGFNSFYPPVNDVYTWLGVQAINNGAAIAPNNLTNIVFQYSNNLRRNQQQAITSAAWSYWLKGVLPPDGFFEFDFGIRKGLALKRDVFDSFNYTKVTNLQIQFNIPGNATITSPSQIRFISEALRYIAQH